MGVQHCDGATSREVETGSSLFLLPRISDLRCTPPLTTVHAADDAAQPTDPHSASAAAAAPVVARLDVTVTNGGGVAGADVVQLYLRYPEEAARGMRGWSAR